METNTTHREKDSISSKVSNTVSYVKGLMAERPHNLAGRGVEMGVHALIGKTVLRRLPAPLNMFAPMLIEKLVLRYGVEEGRELLIKGLRWVKKVTDEEPEPSLS